MFYVASTLTDSRGRKASHALEKDARASRKVMKACASMGAVDMTKSRSLFPLSPCFPAASGQTGIRRRASVVRPLAEQTENG